MSSDLADSRRFSLWLAESWKSKGRLAAWPWGRAIDCLHSLVIRVGAGQLFVAVHVSDRNWNGGGIGGTAWLLAKCLSAACSISGRHWVVPTDGWPRCAAGFRLAKLGRENLVACCKNIGVVATRINPTCIEWSPPRRGSTHLVHRQSGSMIGSFSSFHRDDIVF